MIGGISLSPAFVVMFVMRHCQLSWEDALHLVQNRRYCISPNGGFLTQIKVHNFLAEKVALSSLILTSFNYLCRNTNLYIRPKLRLPIFPQFRCKEWCLVGRETMKKIRGLYYPALSLAHSNNSHRIEDRKRVLVDSDDEDGDDRMMATEP